MVKLLSLNRRPAFDVVNLVAGLALLLSPWYLGFTTETSAARNAWIVGAAIVAIAVAALLAFHEAEEWINLVVGLWAVVAPWMLGFAAVAAATWAHVIAGIIVAAVAAACIWFVKSGAFSTG